MASLVIANAALVRLIWSLSGTDYAVNVLGAVGTPTGSIDQALTNQVGTAIKAGFTSSGLAARTVASVALNKVGLRSIGQANRPEFLDAGAPTPGGDAANNMLPPQVALCVTLRTANAGKSFRGRVYLPGATVTQNSAIGQSNAAYTQDCVDFITAIKDALTASGMQLAVLSRKNALGTPVTLIQARDIIWDTVRRRSVPGI